MRILSILLSASLAVAGFGPGAAAQTVPANAGSGSGAFGLALPLFSAWLRDPAAAALTAGIDSYLTDLANAQLLADPAATAPLVRGLERRAGSDGRKLLGRLASLGWLSRGEPIEVVAQFSAARREAAPEVEAALARAAPDSETAAARELEKAVAASRVEAVRAKA